MNLPWVHVQLKLRRSLAVSLFGALLSAALLLAACGGDSDENGVATGSQPVVPGSGAANPTPGPDRTVTLMDPYDYEPPAATEVAPPTPTSPAAAATVAPAATQPPAPAATATTAPPAAAPPVTINLRAANLAFDRTSITVTRGASVTLTLTNADTSVPHDIGVSIPNVPHSATCSGPCTASITFAAASAGRYTFQCSIHPDMVGDFIVQ